MEALTAIAAAVRPPKEYQLEPIEEVKRRLPNMPRVAARTYHGYNKAGAQVSIISWCDVGTLQADA